MKNRYDYRVVSCLKRNYIYDNKEREYILNRVKVFDSKKNEIVFESCSAEMLRKYGEIKFEHDIQLKRNIDLSKAMFFIVNSGKKDEWSSRTKYDLYLDINLLEGAEITLEERDSPLEKVSQDVFKWDDITLFSYVRSEEKDLETLKAYEVKRLMYLIGMVECAETKEELKKVQNDYSLNKIFISDWNLGV